MLLLYNANLLLLLSIDRMSRAQEDAPLTYTTPSLRDVQRLLPCYAQCQISQPLCQNKYFNKSIPALQIKKLQYQNRYFNKSYVRMNISINPILSRFANKNYNVRMNISLNPFLLANEKTITLNIYQFFYAIS